ncbi:MAG: hypothetical protein H6739_17330 [Alphaproteobacteria bacterium]|nr:hypothetical protein [Alphaproteobacteria bacterium]
MLELRRFDACQQADAVSALRPPDPLDMVDGTHVGAWEDDQLVGLVSGWQRDPDGAANGSFLYCYGPFGAHGPALARALIDAVSPRKDLTAWAVPEPVETGPIWAALGFTPSGAHLACRLPEPPPDPVHGQYSASSIIVLDGLAHVRHRPAMHLGPLGTQGIQTILESLVLEALDEQLASPEGEVSVTAHPDGAWTVRDNGPGLPVETRLPNGRTLLSRLCNQLFGRWTLSRQLLGVSVGLGLPWACALGERLVVTVDRSTGRWRQTFGRGFPLDHLQRLGPPQSHGTTVTFRPDPLVFGDAVVPVQGLRERLEEFAALVPDARLLLNGVPLSGTDGLIGLLRGRTAAPLAAEALAEGEHEGVRVRVAAGWVDADVPPRTWAWANLTPLTETSTSVQGAYRALKGLTARGRVLMVDCWPKEPRYGNQTRDLLLNEEAREAVAQVLAPVAARLLAAHPELAAPR